MFSPTYMIFLRLSKRLSVFQSIGLTVTNRPKYDHRFEIPFFGRSLWAAPMLKFWSRLAPCIACWTHAPPLFGSQNRVVPTFIGWNMVATSFRNWPGRDLISVRKNMLAPISTFWKRAEPYGPVWWRVLPNPNRRWKAPAQIWGVAWWYWFGTDRADQDESQLVRTRSEPDLYSIVPDLYQIRTGSVLDRTRSVPDQYRICTRSYQISTGSELDRTRFVLDQYLDQYSIVPASADFLQISTDQNRSLLDQYHSSSIRTNRNVNHNFCFVLFCFTGSLSTTQVGSIITSQSESDEITT